MDESSAPKTQPKTFTTTKIKENQLLWYKLHVLIYDLRHFSDATSSKRLEKVSAEFYIGSPYFNDYEAETLKATNVPTVLSGEKTLAEVMQATLEERLSRRQKKRDASGDYRVCAAHDLAPIFEKSFGIRIKDLDKDKQFLELLEKNGLGQDIGSWGILSTSNTKGKKKGRK